MNRRFARPKLRECIDIDACQQVAIDSPISHVFQRITLPHALRTRQIHLDFHTSEHIPGIGTDFNADEFARQLKDAHVNSVTVFAKCHHGLLYYDTKRPERHPGLSKKLDLLGEQVDALHRHGIGAPIYISVQCDEYAADTHPEWIAMNPDGTHVGRGPLKNDKYSWQILDMSSPYQDYLYEQTVEVLEKFKPVDGLFFDMCWDQPSASNWAKKAMLKAGLVPENEQHRKKYAHDVSMAYMKRFRSLVKRHAPDAGCYFNSRPLWNMSEEAPMLTQIEIEALPTGGWGYMYFPTNVRFARNFNLPYLGMTARFHKSWADFGGLKPYAALEYEVSQMMAHGAQCSIGDQLHPRGTLDRGAYELIGKVYKRVADREPWLESAKPVTEIGVLFVEDATGKKDAGPSREGWTRMLTQLKHQFDIILSDSDLSQYKLVILPDATSINPTMGKRLDTFTRAGGAVLATGTSGMTDDAATLTWKALPVKPHGMSPFTTTYMRFGKRIIAGVPDSDHVLYDTTVRVKPATGATSLAEVIEPYFERAWDHFSSHAQTPGDKPSGYSLATIKGRVAHIAAPAFASFATHGNYPLRLLVRNVIELLLPEPLLRVEAPTTTEATVARQKNRTIIHLLQYAPERRTRELDIVEDIVPLMNVAVSLRVAKKPRRVYVAPQEVDVAFTYEQGRMRCVVPDVTGHAMIVVE